MAKKESARPYSVEIQKGPIEMREQYTQKFYREPERTMQDMHDNFLRQEKMTMTLHEPKR